MPNFLFFDIETPTRLNDSICSIGVVLTDNCGNKLFTEHYYVNPEKRFDSWSVNFHGVSPGLVKDAPNFKELWIGTLSTMFEKSIVVAHNASSDLSVLGKTLDHYSLQKPSINYACTLQISKHALELENYDLLTVSDALGINLVNHHDALEDTLACCEIFWTLANGTFCSDTYSTMWQWKKHDPSQHRCSTCNAILTDLYGITLGISADSIFAEGELCGYRDWLERNKEFKSSMFVCTAYGLVEDVVENACLTTELLNEIINFTRPFVLDNTSNSKETVKTQALIGALRGIACDGKINHEEAIVLRDWIEDIDLPDNTSVQGLKTALARALEDGVVDSNEEIEILQLCNSIIDPVNTISRSDGAVTIDFNDKQFVITGEFSNGMKRSQIEELICERGGRCAKKVSRRVDFVLVGGEGSSAYKNGNYGGKIEDAMNLKAQGHYIQVVTEEDFMSRL